MYIHSLWFELIIVNCTQKPVYYIELAKMNAVQYNCPAIHPTFYGGLNVLERCWLNCDADELYCIMVKYWAL